MSPHLLFIAFFLLQSTLAFAQSVHGKITYSVRFEEVELSQEELSLLPSQALISFKGDRMRMDMSMGLGMESSVIVQKDQVLVLMDVLGDKFAMRTSRDEIRKDSKGPDAFLLKQLTDEYKDIAGYRCRKAILQAKGQEDIAVWYTGRFHTPATWYYQMDGIEGFPMEFTLKITGMAIRMSARTVSEDAPSDELFIVGGEYRIIKQEEITRMMGTDR